MNLEPDDFAWANLDVDPDAPSIEEQLAWMPKVIKCSLCPELAIPYTPGEGRLIGLWAEHKLEKHPEPKMQVVDRV